MKTLERSFTIELTTDEIDIITTALHGQYKHNKEMLFDKPTSPEYITRHMTQSQELRNSFAHLIGRSYMGEDA